jgi:glycyl-tRNA synthetase
MLCHTSHAARWPIGRRAVVTIDDHRTPGTGVRSKRPCERAELPTFRLRVGRCPRRVGWRAVVTMEKVVALCKRRGFVFPASEIYGGIANTYDYGHYGVLLKNNVIAEWWKSMIQERDDVVALDSAIIQHPRTWEASGHLEGFTDPLVDCRACHLRFRADHLEEERAGVGNNPEIRCGRAPSKLPGEHPDCDLTDPREFNLMFETTIGPVKEAASTVFLRPETAQGIFLDFKTTLQYARRKPPFGIAQVGKSFRNEITPGNFIFRTLEFEQMEMEFFVPPADAGRWFEHWKQARMDWYVELGIEPDNLRLRPHGPAELSHYSSATSDIEYLYPIGWSELEGIANRGDFDLTQHAKFSGEKLEYVDTATQERYVPHVIEPAAGVARTMLALLCDAYHEEEVAGSQRTVLRLHPKVAPVKVAVLPLVNRDGMPELAREIYEELRPLMPAEYDAGGSIGRRYRRQDEIGTPWGVTVDGQTIEDRTVTLRDRDSLEQVRVPLDELGEELQRRLAGGWRSPKLAA